MAGSPRRLELHVGQYGTPIPPSRPRQTPGAAASGVGTAAQPWGGSEGFWVTLSLQACVGM